MGEWHSTKAQPTFAVSVHHSQSFRYFSCGCALSQYTFCSEHEMPIPSGHEDNHQCWDHIFTHTNTRPSRMTRFDSVGMWIQPAHAIDLSSSLC